MNQLYDNRLDYLPTKPIPYGYHAMNQLSDNRHCLQLVRLDYLGTRLDYLGTAPIAYGYQATNQLFDNRHCLTS